MGQLEVPAQPATEIRPLACLLLHPNGDLQWAHVGDLGGDIGRIVLAAEILKGMALANLRHAAQQPLVDGLRTTAGGGHVLPAVPISPQELEQLRRRMGR